METQPHNLARGAKDTSFRQSVIYICNILTNEADLLLIHHYIRFEFLNNVRKMKSN